MGHEEYEDLLVTAAMNLDARAHLVVLLGGEAGLRCGEAVGAGGTGRE